MCCVCMYNIGLLTLGTLRSVCPAIFNHLLMCLSLFSFVDLGHTLFCCSVLLGLYSCWSAGFFVHSISLAHGERYLTSCQQCTLAIAWSLSISSDIFYHNLFLTSVPLVSVFSGFARVYPFSIALGRTLWRCPSRSSSSIWSEQTLCSTQTNFTGVSWPGMATTTMNRWLWFVIFQ